MHWSRTSLLPEILFVRKLKCMFVTFKITRFNTNSEIQAFLDLNGNLI